MHAAEIIRLRLTDDAKAGIAESICESPHKIRSLPEIAAGLVLAGLSEMSCRPPGARAVARALVQDEPLSLENLAEIMRGSQANMCMEQGAATVVDLLGGDFIECCGRTLNAYAGIGIGAAKSLVSLISPVAISAFQQSLTQLGPADGETVAKAFDDQRGSILSLFPDDLKLGQFNEPRLIRCEQYLREAAPAVPESLTPPAAAPANPFMAFLSRMMPLIMIGLVVVAITDRLIVTQRQERARQVVTVQAPESPDVAADHAVLVAARLGPDAAATATPTMEADPSLLALLESVRSSLLHIHAGGDASPAMVELQLSALRSQRQKIEEKSLLDWRSRRQGLDAVSSQTRQLAHNFAQATDDPQLHGAFAALEQELARW